MATRKVLHANLDTIAGSAPTQETPAGAIDGSNATFTLSVSPSLCQIFVNGILQGSGDYSRSGATITFQAGAIPASGDTLTALLWE